MSVKSWVNKFYVDSLKCKTDLDCVAQARTKFLGLSEYHKLDYRVRLYNGAVYENDSIMAETVFRFTSETCGFCKKYTPPSAHSPICTNCPVAKANGMRDCDHPDSPFRQFKLFGIVPPVIELLDKIESKCNTHGEYQQ